MSIVDGTPNGIPVGTPLNMRPQDLKEYLLGGHIEVFHRDPVWLEPENEWNGHYDRRRANTVYLRLWTSQKNGVTLENFSHFLSLLKGVREPISLEVFGNKGELTYLVVAQKGDAETLKGAVGSVYPDFYLEELDADLLLNHYRRVKVQEEKFQFGLLDVAFTGREFLNIRIPERDFRADPLKLLYQIFIGLDKEELGFYQVVFIPAAQDWPRLIRELLCEKIESLSYTNARARVVSKSPHFHEHNLSYYMGQAGEKLEHPLFLANARLGFFCHKGRLNPLLKASRRALESFATPSRRIRVFTRQDYNNWGIKKSDHIYLFLNRCSFRLGNLFSAGELAGLYHFPSQGMLEKGWPILTLPNSFPAPDGLCKDGEILGINFHQGITKGVKIGTGLQNRHIYICGASGCGKSTLLQNIALQHLEKGDGFGVIDPHGELIERLILPYIPEDRVKDVVYFHAIDTRPAFNVLAHDGSEFEREIIRADLVKILTEMLEAPLGVNISLLLNNILKTLLQKRDSTLEDIYSIVLDTEYRKRIVDQVKDYRLRIFWEKEFPILSRQGQLITGITNKVNLFLSSSTIAPMLTQKQNRIDFLDIMDCGKIFLCNLSHGDLHEENSSFLGRLIASKIQTTAMRRNGNARDWYLLIDEFQSFATPSMKVILTGGRKFRLHVALANQEIKDIPDNLLRNVLDASTVIFFGSNEPKNKEYAEKVLLKRFRGEELGRLGKGEALVKMGEHVFNLKTYPSPPKPKEDFVAKIVEHSLKTYGYEERDTTYRDNIPLKPKRKRIIESPEAFDEI